MNIHEHQAKAVCGSSGFPSPPAGRLHPRRGRSAASELGGPVWVVKSQIHAGGRGKGRFKELAAGAKGGVRLVKSIEEVKKRPGPCSAAPSSRSRPVRRASGQPPLRRGRLRHRPRVLPVAAGRPGDHADRGGRLHRGRRGHRGGRPRHAREDPHLPVDPATGGDAAPRPRLDRGLKRGRARQAGPKLLARSIRRSPRTTWSMLQVNPLIVTRTATSLLDAKIGFDDNALFRHPDMCASCAT